MNEYSPSSPRAANRLADLKTWKLLTIEADLFQCVFFFFISTDFGLVDFILLSFWVWDARSTSDYCTQYDLIKKKKEIDQSIMKRKESKERKKASNQTNRKIKKWNALLLMQISFLFYSICSLLLHSVRTKDASHANAANSQIATSPSAGSMVHNASNPTELGNGSGNGDFHKVSIYLYILFHLLISSRFVFSLNTWVLSCFYSFISFFPKQSFTKVLWKIQP